MQLLNNLYRILRKNCSNSFVQYDIRLEASHHIYQVHFPGNPITPGVCIIQTVKELLECHLNRLLNIQKVKNVKFLSVISPLETPDVTCLFTSIVMDNTTCSCQTQVQLLAGKRVLSKLSFTCKYL
jgi:3-hydroxyacyl-[acyl-carrier-protein] dehydratase